ncbi:MAG: 2-phospho-L-lactate guanylyltransferase [Acidobacteria bacterium]|nr:2-phospho-L-lactate guanylyltransferase [Acidobacteriota bacterium]
MRYILLPIKDLTRAKQRLADRFTQAERTELAWAMLEHTFAAVAAVKNIDGVAVVTLYQPAIALAERYGFAAILEREQVSESHSVDFGSRELTARGVKAVLRLPLDLPLLQTADIETILSHDMQPAPSCVIVPSREGTGTNAILRRPPALFPSHFGQNSLPKHLAEAEIAKAQCTVIELPRIALDIDDANDVSVLLATEDDSPVRQWLLAHSIHERLTDSGA